MYPGGSCFTHSRNGLRNDIKKQGGGKANWGRLSDDTEEMEEISGQIILPAEHVQASPTIKVVLGPAGSGKTTYCFGLQQFYSGIGRHTVIVNLDPGNVPESCPYTPDISVSDLCTLYEVMKRDFLGPNGGLKCIYHTQGLLKCMHLLLENFSWLEQQIELLLQRQEAEPYFLFDCPGQAELFTHDSTLQHLVMLLDRRLQFRLVAVNLVDSSYCIDLARFVSALLLSLNAMVRLELPHVNVLSKIDLVPAFEGSLRFPLEFYTRVMDLDLLIQALSEGRDSSKFQRLNAAICDLVGEMSMVGFCPLAIEDKESVVRLARLIDKSNGYVFGGLTPSNESIMAVANKGDDFFGAL